jgi:1L-myo-inositol 1-phosphate cytidylyltransferase
MDAKITHALIIAAGRGVRFGKATHLCPKPLIEVAGIPLLYRTLLTAYEAGIDHFTVVTGYKAKSLEDYLSHKTSQDLKVQCLRNEKWQRPNGLSVVRAKDHLPDRFLLLMADHLFEPQILRNLVAVPLAAGHCRLAVDFHPERIPDLEDATKVAVLDGQVKEIGKEITNYNAVDTGIFFCTPGIFEGLESAISKGKESLSDGIRELACCDRMEAMDIGDLFWQDIDDEAGRLAGEKRLAELSQKGHGEQNSLPFPQTSKRRGLSSRASFYTAN